MTRGWEAFRHSFVGEFLLEAVLPLFTLAGLFLLAIIFLFSNVRWAPQVPKCPEDTVIVGGGQYHNGYWDYLYCGPAVDDYRG